MYAPQVFFRESLEIYGKSCKCFAETRKILFVGMLRFTWLNFVGVSNFEVVSIIRSYVDITATVQFVLGSHSELSGLCASSPVDSDPDLSGRVHFVVHRSPKLIQVFAKT